MATKVKTQKIKDELITPSRHPYRLNWGKNEEECCRNYKGNFFINFRYKLIITVINQLSILRVWVIFQKQVLQHFSLFCVTHFFQ